MGGGEPLAAHFKVTFIPSCTTISVLVEKSRMSGGTTTSGGRAMGVQGDSLIIE